MSTPQTTSPACPPQTQDRGCAMHVQLLRVSSESRLLWAQQATKYSHNTMQSHGTYFFVFVLRNGTATVSACRFENHEDSLVGETGWNTIQMEAIYK